MTHTLLQHICMCMYYIYIYIYTHVITHLFAYPPPFLSLSPSLSLYLSIQSVYLPNLSTQSIYPSTYLSIFYLRGLCAQSCIFNSTNRYYREQGSPFLSSGIEGAHITQQLETLSKSPDADIVALTVTVVLLYLNPKPPCSKKQHLPNLKSQEIWVAHAFQAGLPGFE